MTIKISRVWFYYLLLFIHRALTIDRLKDAFKVPMRRGIAEFGEWAE